MAANTSPIFLLTPRTASASTGLSANTALDGTGVLTTVFTAGASGSKVEDVYLWHLGTNIATAIRFFVGGKLVHEETMAANTLSQTAASIPILWRANLVLAASAVLTVTIGTAIASGIMVTAVGGDY